MRAATAWSVALLVSLALVPGCAGDAPADDPATVEARDDAVGVVDHYVFELPDQASAERLADQVTQRNGWSVSDIAELGPGDWGLVLQQDLGVDGRDVEAVADELESLAADVGGVYDGWGMPIG